LQSGSATTRSLRCRSTATAGLSGLKRIRGATSIATTPKPSTTDEAIAKPTQPSAGGTTANAVSSPAAMRRAPIVPKRARLTLAPA
jgi:hypothetical protein